MRGIRLLCNRSGVVVNIYFLKENMPILAVMSVRTAPVVSVNTDSQRIPILVTSHASFGDSSMDLHVLFVKLFLASL